MKRISALLMLTVLMLSAFSFSVYADDNATGGDGNTSWAASGYAWYNPYQYLYKVTIFVGKSDTATKQSSLTGSFYRIGTVIMKSTGWSVDSSVMFGSATKVDYYGGTAMTRLTSPHIISDANCPAVPIACGGDIDTVKAYFGSTGTLNTVLNAIATKSGTTAYGLLSGKSFTISGETKSGWPSSYLLPNGTSNRVPWVIIYEPMVVMHLKDQVSQVAFTATEFAISAKNGWYDWHLSGGSGQNVYILPYCHLPTSIQLEESWFGYPVFPTRSDSYVWSYDEIVKGGGWGMRWLPKAVTEPTLDYSVEFGEYTASPKVDESTSFKIEWTNFGDKQGTVLCELYDGSSLVWSSEKTINSKIVLITTMSLTFHDNRTHTLTAKINWSNRTKESNPNNNSASISMTPVGTPKSTVDYSVVIDSVPTPKPNTTENIRITWKNKTTNAGEALCEIYVDSVCVFTDTKSFSAGLSITADYNIYFAGTKNHSVEARINWSNRSKEVEPNDNSSKKTVLTDYDKTYDFSVTNLTVTPATVYQNNTVTVTFKTNNLNKDLSYTGISVEVLLDSTVLKSTTTSFAANGTNTHTYTFTLANEGTKTFTARVNWANRSKESNSTNNSAEKSVTVKRYYDFSVSNLEIEPDTVFDNETVTVTFRTDNNDKYNAYTNIPVQVLYRGWVVYTGYFDYAKNAGKEHTVTINVGSNLGQNEIKARVNWQDRTNEVITTNNVTAAKYVTVNENKDLTLEIIEPNSDYREGVTVMTSCRIYNKSLSHVVPSSDCAVAFKVYYRNGTDVVTVTEQRWEQAVIPSKDSNLVYFKWTVPDGTAGKNMCIFAFVNADRTVEEIRDDNNGEVMMKTVAKYPDSQTPNTRFEYKKPNGYTVPAVPSVTTGAVTWDVWEYTTTFVKKTYGVSLSASQPRITPDADSPSRSGSRTSWTMRSGYGVTMSYVPAFSPVSGSTYASSDMYTDVQTVVALFPEFSYSSANWKCRVLEKTGYAEWKFIENTNADGNERLHFTPIWFPDGDYVVSVVAYDLWTPAGMITGTRNSYPVTISQSAYDDWYVASHYKSED